tara:strand:- start:330 stop:626 length:297 start_codon:yes stop_codon:yes gene_type:complete
LIEEEIMEDNSEPNNKSFWLDNKKNVDKIWYALVTICILTVLADLFYHKHVEFEVEDIIPGMYGWYGFIGCVFLVLAAKILRKIIMRPENYYNENQND